MIRHSVTVTEDILLEYFYILYISMNVVFRV